MVITKAKAEERRLSKKMSYKALAYQILAQEGKPLHWGVIAERAFLLGRKASFNPAAIRNVLVRHLHLFVRVNVGTYALVEWGYSRIDTYVDIIASILKASNRALPTQTIYHGVCDIRPVKETTLTMSLAFHPRFYRSLEGTYGLRVWLLAQEKQALPTPDWLVEERDSYQRLEQAMQRGYNVDRLLKMDLDSVPMRDEQGSH